MRIRALFIATAIAVLAVVGAVPAHADDPAVSNNVGTPVPTCPVGMDCTQGVQPVPVPPPGVAAICFYYFLPPIYPYPGPNLTKGNEYGQGLMLYAPDGFGPGLIFWANDEACGDVNLAQAPDVKITETLQFVSGSFGWVDDAHLAGYTATVEHVVHNTNWTPQHGNVACFYKSASLPTVEFRLKVTVTTTVAGHAPVTNTGVSQTAYLHCYAVDPN